MTTVLTAQQPGADGPSKALEGRWSIELHLDKPSERFEPMAGQINGEIDFSSMAWWSPTDRFGRHDLNLQSFFGNRFLKPANVTSFGPGDTSMVTEVSGYVRGDSVGIDFIPRVDHGGVSMWGQFWGDSAKGRWYRRGADGEGHFVLRRLSHDAVAVASIPDGRPTAVAAAPPPPPKKLTKAEARALAKNEAAAKAKAHADSLAVARADARKAAKAAALAKAAARDSANAVALAEAKVKAAARDSARTQALAVAQARRDSIKARTAAAAQAKADARTQALATAKARRDSIAGARLAAAPTKATQSSATPNATATVASASANTAGTSRLALSAPGAPPPTPAAAGPSTTPGAAPLRVRIYDIASNNYFSTKYSLHLPDGHWLYGTLKSGANPDGWGPAVVRPPGKYEIEVTDFLCGDKIWFLKDKIVKPVVIEPGTPTDVTIDIDVPSTPARPSLENKSGANCTDTPGGKS